MKKKSLHLPCDLASADRLADVSRQSNAAAAGVEGVGNLLVSLCCPWAAINKREGGNERGNEATRCVSVEQARSRAGAFCMSLACSKAAMQRRLGGSSESGKPWGLW